MGSIHGRDYSVVQSGGHPIDWAAEAAVGIQFAYLRCSVGNDGPDVDFAKNVEGAAKAGIAVGPYEFFYDLPVAPDHPSRAPEAQADAFVKAATVGGVLIGSKAGHMPPAVDLEWPTPDERARWGIASSLEMRDRAAANLKAVKDRFGCAPLAYTYPYWWRAEQAELDYRFTEYPLWLASYGGLMPTPLKPWAGWCIWQTSGGTIEFCKLLDGGRVPVDGDVIGSETMFQQLLSRDPPPQAA